VTAALASEFLATRAGALPTEDLEAELAAAIERVGQTWPGARIDSAQFARELGLRAAPEVSPIEALRALRAEDSYLAFACSSGDPAALAHYERAFVPRLRPTLARMGLTPSEIDETLQVMREELFVARAGERPRITNYAGRGELRGWLRAVAARTGLRLVRRPIESSPLGESVASPVRDPELECLRQTYGQAFREGLREALAALSIEDRLLLKRRFAHGLSCEELGTVYGVHRSTAARRVEDARGRLVDALRGAVMQRLHMGRAEFSSLLPLLQSELSLSLSSVAPPASLADRVPIEPRDPAARTAS